MQPRPSARVGAAEGARPTAACRLSFRVACTAAPAPPRRPRPQHRHPWTLADASASVSFAPQETAGTSPTTHPADALAAAARACAADDASCVTTMMLTTAAAAAAPYDNAAGVQSTVLSCRCTTAIARSPCFCAALRGPAFPAAAAHASRSFAPQVNTEACPRGDADAGDPTIRTGGRRRRRCSADARPPRVGPTTAMTRTRAGIRGTMAMARSCWPAAHPPLGLAAAASGLGHRASFFSRSQIRWLSSSELLVHVIMCLYHLRCAHNSNVCSSLLSCVLCVLCCSGLLSCWLESWKERVPHAVPTWCQCSLRSGDCSASCADLAGKPS